MNTTNQTRARDSKTVFALRKEGRLEEALAIGRELHAAMPADVWSTRALGWVLVDLTKLALEQQGMEVACGYFQELAALAIPGDDEILLKSRRRLESRCRPGGELLTRAAAADKQGHLTEAVTLYRQAVAQQDSPEAQTGLAWCFYKLIRTFLKDENPDVMLVSSALEEYVRLPLVERPSRLHSLMLMNAIRVAENYPGFPDFVKCWDPATLQPEDWVEQKGEGDKVYRPLAARLVTALYKAIRKSTHPREIAWVVPFMEQALERMPREEWLPYQFGKILIKLGERDRARQLVLPVIRAKRRESWAWDVLASTCGDGEHDLRKACLCKALLCGHKDEEFLVSIRQELALILVAEGEYPEAKHEVTRCVATRQARKWRIPDVLERLLEAPWFQTTTATVENQEYYREYAPVADSLAFEGLPWFTGVISGKQDPKPGFKGGIWVLLARSERFSEIRVNPKALSGQDPLPMGAPVEVRIIDSEEREVIGDLRRRSGPLWDILPEQPGIVSRVNAEKHLAAVAIGVDEVVLAHFDNFPVAESLREGQPVMVRCKPALGDYPPRLATLCCVENLPEATFVKRFTASLRVEEGQSFGFAGEVFIPPHLVPQDAASGVVVEGTALLETERRKMRKGWRAVTVTITI